jgi:hypothetical protein
LSKMNFAMKGDNGTLSQASKSGSRIRPNSRRSGFDLRLIWISGGLSLIGAMGLGAWYAQRKPQPIVAASVNSAPVAKIESVAASTPAPLVSAAAPVPMASQSAPLAAPPAETTNVAGRSNSVGRGRAAPRAAVATVAAPTAAAPVTTTNPFEDRL